MGGREVSRPCRVWFFAEGERFFMFFVFDSIDDSVTMHNHSPQKFSTEPFSLLYAVNLLPRCAVEFGGVGKNV